MYCLLPLIYKCEYRKCIMYVLLEILFFFGHTVVGFREPIGFKLVFGVVSCNVRSGFGLSLHFRFELPFLLVCRIILT